MGSVSGVEIKIAAKKAATWGTAVAAGANDGFLCLPTSLKRSADLIVDDSLGTYFSTDGTPGAVKVAGDLPAYARYDGFDLLLALFMGTAGSPSTHTAGTNSKDYVYKFATNTDGLFCTIAKNMKNYIAEFPSCKIEKISIKGEVGKPLQFVFTVEGNNIVYNTSSGTNNQTTFNSVTVKEVANRIQFGQGVFRFNVQSGAALSSGDKVYPTAFELTAERKQSGVYGQFTTGVSGNNQELIDEPTNDGKPVITLKLTFPRHASTAATVPAFLTALNADTRYKGDIVFTGKIIEGSIPRVFGLSFPNLQIKTVDVTDAAGIIQEPVEFAVYSASAAPLGMTSSDALPSGKTAGFNITDPFVISGTNQQSTDPLA